MMKNNNTDNVVASLLFLDPHPPLSLLIFLSLQEAEWETQDGGHGTVSFLLLCKLALVLSISSYSVCLNTTQYHFSCMQRRICIANACRRLRWQGWHYGITHIPTQNIAVSNILK